MTYTPVFYPGMSDPGKAQWIDLVPGQEFTASFRIATAPAREIRGRIAWDGEIIGGFLRLAGPVDESPWCGSWQSDPESRDFRVSGLSPGTYVLEVTATVGKKHELFRKTVRVGDTDVEGLVISSGDKVLDLERERSGVGPSVGIY